MTETIIIVPPGTTHVLPAEEDHSNQVPNFFKLEKDDNPQFYKTFDKDVIHYVWSLWANNKWMKIRTWSDKTNKLITLDRWLKDNDNG